MERVRAETAEWYVQKGARVQGPYSASEVGRFLLLGRVRHCDRVSRDGELWEPVTQVPELVPEELLDLESPDGWQRFVDARAAQEQRGTGAAAGHSWPDGPGGPSEAGPTGEAAPAGHGIRIERRHLGATDGHEGPDGMAARLRAEWRSADVGRVAPPPRPSAPNLLPWSLLCLTLVALGVVLWLDRAALPAG